MAHFARLDENNQVIEVVVVSNDDILDEDDNENEQVGMGFLKSLYGQNTIWRQTSYNNHFRGRYAKIGDTFVENVSTLGVASTSIFLRPKPFESWTLDTITPDWVSPLGPPPTLTQTQIDEGYLEYVWDESSYQSDNTTGWVLR